MIYGICAAAWAAVGVFLMGFFQADSIEESLVTILLWPFIPAYFLGTRMREKLDQRAAQRRRQ